MLDEAALVATSPLSPHYAASAVRAGANCPRSEVQRSSYCSVLLLYANTSGQDGVGMLPQIVPPKIVQNMYNVTPLLLIIGYIQGMQTYA